MCISTLYFKINFYVLEYFMSCFNLKTHPYFIGVLQKYKFSHKGFADIKSLKTISLKHLTFMYLNRFLIFVTTKYCSLHLKVTIKNFFMPISIVIVYLPHLMKHSTRAKQIQHEKTTHLDLHQYETFHDYTILYPY